jgi:hypothetical protein
MLNNDFIYPEYDEILLLLFKDEEYELDLENLFLSHFPIHKNKIKIFKTIISYFKMLLDEQEFLN